MAPKHQAPRGTRDLLPPDSATWTRLERLAAHYFDRDHAEYEPAERPPLHGPQGLTHALRVARLGAQRRHDEKRAHQPENDSARRLVAVEALVIQASQTEKGKASADAKQARNLLEKLATSGPPLARLAAQIGRAFVGAKLEEMHAFFDRMYGG